MLKYREQLKKLRKLFIGLLSLIFITGFTVTSNAKVLVVGQIAEPKSLDPSTVTAVNDFRIVMKTNDRRLIKNVLNFLKFSNICSPSLYLFRIKPNNL